MGRYESYWPAYVPVAKRRRQAEQKVSKMKKAGRPISPVQIEGRRITTTFWGDAWCKNLEAYSDYANRLPRGRTYVRNGSVIDLQIEAGRVRALVSGTDLYTVDIKIKRLPKQKWTEIKGECAGQIGSLVELLQGSLSKSVMEIVTRKGEGLFPSPREIPLSCSCPDWATMCKHVAATLYGVGARLDHAPELLFTLRGVEPTEMVEAALNQPAAAGKARKGRLLETAELSSVFGVDIDMDVDGSSTAADETKSSTQKAATKTRAAKKPITQKAATKTRAAKKPITQKAATKATTTKATATKATTTTTKATTRKRSAAQTQAKKPAGRNAGAKTSTANTANANTANANTANANTANANTARTKRPAANTKTKTTKKPTPEAHG